MLAVHDHALARALGRQVCATGDTQRVEPGGLHVVAVDALDGPAHGQLEGGGVDAERGCRCRVPHHDLVAEALDERPGDGARDRRHEAAPVGAQSWRQHRDGDHQPPHAPQPRVGLHHLGVREDIRPADLDDAGALGVVSRCHEVVEHVADGDGLAERAHPARRDHHRQVLDEAAQQLEGGAAGPDDDGGPELGDRDAVGGQLRPDRLPAGEMRREPAVRVAETAEVDDVTDASRACRAPERARRIPVSLLEAVLAAGHRVGQVIGQTRRPRGQRAGWSGRRGRAARSRPTGSVRRGLAGPGWPVARGGRTRAGGRRVGLRRTRWRRPPGCASAPGSPPMEASWSDRAWSGPAQATPRRFWKAIWRSWVMPVRKPASLMDR